MSAYLFVSKHVQTRKMANIVDGSILLRVHVFLPNVLDHTYIEASQQLEYSIICMVV